MMSSKTSKMSSQTLQDDQHLPPKLSNKVIKDEQQDPQELFQGLPQTLPKLPQGSPKTFQDKQNIFTKSAARPPREATKPPRREQKQPPKMCFAMLILAVRLFSPKNYTQNWPLSRGVSAKLRPARNNPRLPQSSPKPPPKLPQASPRGPQGS